jgi:hypothetical protein
MKGDHFMGDRLDAFAKQLAGQAPRRRVLQSLGALGLGSLGVLGIDRAAEAKSCKKKCKDHCKNKHKNRGSNRQCRKRCQNKCG